MTTEPDRIDAVTQITDHEAGGVALLPAQFRKPVIEAVLRSWLGQVQAIEDAAWQLYTDTLETAIGVQLDQIGALLGLSRGTLTDAHFRVVLKALVIARRSNGTADDVLRVMGALVDDAIGFDLREGAASLLLELREPLFYDGEKAAFVLKLAKAGGIQLQLIDPPVAEDELFAFASAGLLAESDGATGFSDVDQITGGSLTGVLA